jgi:hypothetical protein
MAESWVEQLEAWHDFYVIVGGGAAALTGVMFIVASLRTREMAVRRKEGERAYVTPTVFFFASVLVMAALMTIPTISRTLLGALLAFGALGSLVYLVVVGGKAHWRKNRLDAEDRIFYIGLPYVSYLLLLATGLALWSGQPHGLEFAGGASLLLLMVGVHNAWDLVLWMTEQRKE